MTKRFIFFLLLVLILSSIVYNIFQKLGEQSKVFQEPQNFFPPNPVFFLEAKEFFTKNDYKIESKFFKNCEHRIPTEGSSLGLEFLKKNLY